jgi:DNA helicase IV
MTPEQVKAFIGRMDGMMLVTGAPGSGKTTVALQRIRFLFNQQLEIQGLNVTYSEKATRVFLANENLIP